MSDDVTDPRLLAGVAFEVSQLLGEFSYRLDNTDASTVHELFTLSGRYAIDGVALTGHDEIRDGYARRADRGPRTTRHLFSLPRFEEVSEESVRITTVMVLYAADGSAVAKSLPPVLIADVADHIVRTESGLKFQDRSMTSVFRGNGPVVSPMAVPQKEEEAQS